MLRLFGCRRFRRLCEEREDRTISPRQLEFMATHRTACTPCRREEAASENSLNMLRSMSLSVDPTDAFDTRLVRMVKIERGRERLAYWFPAVIGAGIASFAMFALMQLVTASHSVKPFLVPASARNTVAPIQSEPRLILPAEARQPAIR
jgi:hypothetical protein